MNISFGKKIPISKACVLDRQENKFKDVTLYEFDGKDSSDIDYFACQTGKWSSLKSNITIDLYDKHKKSKENNNARSIEKKFYSMEAEEGKSIGVCETFGFGFYTDIHYLECNPELNYKYTGQTMLASIAKQLLKKNDSPVLGVSDPADSARTFYTQECGFVPQYENSRELELNKEQMTSFIQTVENKTNTKIIDLNC